MRALGLGVVVGMLALVVGVRLARSQAPAATPGMPAEHTVMAPSDVKWGDPPPALPKGAQMAVLAGDPTKTGLFVLRLKMPAGYKIMPHSHPTDENITVLSGSFVAGMGDKFDPQTKALPAGSFVHMPAKMHHFAMAKGETTVEIASMGPFVINYLDPKDDPSKKQAAAR